jgi:hypothetical protein
MSSQFSEFILRLWAAILFLIALPLGLFTLVYLNKLFSANLAHVGLELLLVIATATGLLSPLIFAIQNEKVQRRLLVISILIVGGAVAALSSPLSRGFAH